MKSWIKSEESHCSVCGDYLRLEYRNESELLELLKKPICLQCRIDEENKGLSFSKAIELLCNGDCDRVTTKDTMYIIELDKYKDLIMTFAGGGVKHVPKEGWFVTRKKVAQLTFSEFEVIEKFKNYTSIYSKRTLSQCSTREQSNFDILEVEIGLLIKKLYERFNKNDDEV